jgi:ABC-type transport system involved in multi-copper enzyme maturation permease subunit
MRGIIGDCFVEMVDRKIIHVFAVVTVLAVLAVLLSSQMDMEFHVSGDLDMQPMTDLMRNPVIIAISTFMQFLLFLIVMASAGVVPNMLVRGRADFYLSKPLSRISLLLNKLFGIWLTYGVVMTLTGVITYIMIVLVFGLFDWKIISLFALNLVSFVIWLSITTTVGILSGSTAMSIMSAFLIWVAQLILGLHEQIKAFLDSKTAGFIVDVLYYIVPKTGEIRDITESLALGKPVYTWMPLYSSLIFALVLVYLAAGVFKRKDY